MSAPSPPVRQLRRLAADESGATAVLFAFSLLVLIGLLGLGIDLGASYALQRQAQDAADSAAYSAAVTLRKGSRGPDPFTQADAVIAAHALKDAVVAVHAPPESGLYVGNSSAVEVVIERPAARYFSSLFLPAATPLRARAVAMAGAAPCIMALDPSDGGTLQFGGSGRVELDDCSAYGASTSAQALQISGAARLEAESVDLVGGASGKDAIDAVVRSGVKPIPDPYGHVPVPDRAGCDAKVESGVVRASGSRPYVFCDGLHLQKPIEFEPGVYIIRGGDLRINAGAEVTGRGVTFVLEDGVGMHVSGNASLDLSAPTIGPTAGILFFQDRVSGADGIELNGGADHRLFGALYFPRGDVRVNGNADLGYGACTQIIANKIEFRGGARLSLSGCAGSGIQFGSRPRLVE
jgi:Flp pilus assembly protein TadG